MDFIEIKGARQHNLKNISLKIPKNKLVVFTGLSGSGKSSLAFDTIYAEGQRRYVESLSSYARQFLGIMDKPDIDSITGLSPSISIDQKSTSHNPRSTVGTITEIYDYLRLLYARIGHPHCKNCGREISRQSLDQIVDAMLDTLKTLTKFYGNAPVKLMLLSPVVRQKKGEFVNLFTNLLSKGYTQARIDGQFFNINSDLVLIKTNKHTIDVVIDKFTCNRRLFKKEDELKSLRSRLTQNCQQGLNLSGGLVSLTLILDASLDFPKNPKKTQDTLFSELFACPTCNLSIPEIEPRSFSFNSPFGACETCHGLGSLLKIDPNLIFNPKLTIDEGGILPYAKMLEHDTWVARIFRTFLSENKINTKITIDQLTDLQKRLILNGTGEQIYTVVGNNRFERQTHIYETFTGVIADLEKRYVETESDYVRGEIIKYMHEEICESCHGKRLKSEILNITILNKSIVDITEMDISTSNQWIKNLQLHISKRENIIAATILKEILFRFSFMLSVGLEYLTLSRKAQTLSGGEAQRIRLASQIGSGLTGVLYVLDEPSIGLHTKDNQKLINTLKQLRDLGNTIVVVEHDREIMLEADWIVDFGPGAGEKGGEIIFSGTPADLLMSTKSVTAKYLKSPSLTYFNRQDKFTEDFLKIIGASENNLKNIDVEFPLGKFICVTGVSGSGKSTLVVETLYQSLMKYFFPFHREKVGVYQSILGTELIDKVILVDQSPIGRTPRSNPATYTGLFSYIRDLFVQIPQSKQKGYGPGRFSFNVKGGRCEACQGDGQIKIEMQFLSDIYVTCEVCHGTRYNHETLEVEYKGKNISQILDMTVSEALDFFPAFASIYAKLETLKDVGLTYIHLGQPAPTLSGGEAQRVKLATELSKKATGRTVYILDEPTTGLHFADLEKLLKVLIRLSQKGNTVIVIEHNLDVIKNADYIIDLGPLGGNDGGKVVTVGTPSQIIQNSRSYTGQYLKKIIE